MSAHNTLFYLLQTYHASPCLYLHFPQLIGLFLAPEIQAFTLPFVFFFVIYFSELGYVYCAIAVSNFSQTSIQRQR